jgi:hypothetical protein
MSNWYFNCPVCEDEVECDVEDHIAPDGRWSTVELPEECTTCDTDLKEFPFLEDDVLAQWHERNIRPWEPEDEDELTHKAYFG